MSRAPGHYGCIEALRQARADPNTTDYQHFTPLHKYFYDLEVEAIDLPRRCGVDIRLRNGLGMTSLHWAARWNAESTANYLIHCEAEIACEDNDSWTPIYFAVYFNSREALAALLRARLGWTLTKDGCSVLHFAGQCASVGVMHLLARSDLHGLDPLQRNECGRTPDDCFFRHRDDTRAITRSTSKEERKAWIALMDSARRQNDVIVELEDEDEPKRGRCSTKSGG